MTGPQTTANPQGTIRKGKVQWERYKPKFQKLYVEENLPLPGVMETMEREHGFTASKKQYRYQFAEKWGWKKYNQDKRPNLDQSTISRPEGELDSKQDSNTVTHCLLNSLSGASSKSIQQFQPEAPERDTAYICEMLYQLRDHFGSESMLPSDNELVMDGKSLRWIRRCFDWCKDQIMQQDARLPDPVVCRVESEMEIDDMLEWDACVFLFLFDRLLMSSGGASEQVQWEREARAIFKRCPVKMLLTMTSLILSAAAAQLPNIESEYLQSLERGSILGMASLGVRCIDDKESGQRWRDEELLQEFCKELKFTTQNGRESDALHIVSTDVIDKYIAFQWPREKRSSYHGYSDIGGFEEFYRDGTSEF
ncbi:Clr5 domain-containing protein [Xylariaceae sp. FL1651]|nr:Clr5 domain-containing protein [Xylariaceae sp. FL1651]